MNPMTHANEKPFNWTPQPEAAKLLHTLLNEFLAGCSAAQLLKDDLLNNAGIRLFDLLDCIALPKSDNLSDELAQLGFKSECTEDTQAWNHSEGLFPTILLHEKDELAIGIKVESASDFLAINKLSHETPIKGQPLSGFRSVCFSNSETHQLWAIERHGYRGWKEQSLSGERTQAIVQHQERLRKRKRSFETSQAGFEHCKSLIKSAIDDLGVDRTCDLFFQAERNYWQTRNRAALVQKARQDSLGIGWANHDHHTYRSSRTHFHLLIEMLELLGMKCRERFYAGKEAGWGAQVLEQANCGITIFADVDLLPEEVAGDFSHGPMAELNQLGTVGLWCALHGDSFLESGLHHLECQYDFQMVTRQLESEGVEVMQPFTDFDYLKQAFTKGEKRAVQPKRIEALLNSEKITQQQAEKFSADGAICSHLEILQRNHGFKGFNQTGISDIITRTDPREQE